MKTYRDLKVWQAGYDVVRALHEDTRRFPMEERYGLARDVRKTSRSVIYNISEGAGRRTLKEQIHFLSISSGSASELECQVLLCRDLGLLPRTNAEAYLRRIGEVRRMLHGMMASLVRQMKPRQRRNADDARGHH